MQNSRPSVGYHILALATILMWGTTFASTKMLLMHELTPPEIILYRFIIAYAMTWVFSRKLRADSLVDELLLAMAGFTGGTLYFMAENTAIDYTITANVALVGCVTPLLTALLTSVVYREHITGRMAVESAAALLGVDIGRTGDADSAGRCGVHPSGCLYGAEEVIVSKIGSHFHPISLQPVMIVFAS